MREYKFRGKIVDWRHIKGLWIYGHLVDQNHIHGVRKCCHRNQIATVEIDPETVGQYTGFTDMAGNEIYENGELVKIDQYGKVYEWTTVKYDLFDGRWLMCNGLMLTAATCGDYKVFP